MTEELNKAWNVVQYIEMARKEMHKPDDWLPTHADVWHSALLQRLWSAKPLYKVPPPRSYSYPNYQIIDDGKEYWSRQFMEIYFRDEYVSINQDARWRYVDGYLTYTGVDRWQLRAVREDEKVQRGYHIHDGPIWADVCLERVDEEDVW